MLQSPQRDEAELGWGIHPIAPETLPMYFYTSKPADAGKEPRSKLRGITEDKLKLITKAEASFGEFNPRD